MITAVLKGGLGNQLFQIAATINLAVEHTEDFGFDPRCWPPRGGAASNGPWQAYPPDTYLDNIYRNIPFMDLGGQPFDEIYREPHYHYSKIEYKPNLVLDGYFQSEKYFKNTADLVRRALLPPQLDPAVLRQKYGIEEKSPMELVAVQVRRGSCLVDIEHHPACPTSYFVDAMSQFDKKKVNFIFFSDDIDWCKETFPDDLHSVNNSDIGDYEDMINCDHHIIANSTFAWWCAWLNPKPNKKIIAPRQWHGPAYASWNTDDLIPAGWNIL